MIGRNPSKLPVHEMPTAFDSTSVVGPSRQHGTLQHFFESFLLLERHHNALDELDNLLYLLGKERNDHTVNYLHIKNMGKERHMNIQIGVYDVDSVILGLGSDVSILTKKTWKNMGRLTLGWSPM